MNDVSGRVVRKTVKGSGRVEESASKEEFGRGMVLSTGWNSKLPNTDLMHQIIAKSFMWWIECISKNENIKLSNVLKKIEFLLTKSSVVEREGSFMLLTVNLFQQFIFSNC